MMGPFCPEQGTSSHAILKDLASTDEKTMFSGEEVGSEKEIFEKSYQFILRLRRWLFIKQSYKLLLILYMLNP